MYKTVSIFLLLFVQNQIFCQLKSLPKTINDKQDLFLFEAKLSGEVVVPDNLYVGSPYFINDWSKGEVTLRTGQVIHNKFLKYNGLTDDLIWHNDSTFLEVRLDKNLISEFVLLESNESVKYLFKKIRVPSIIGKDTIEAFAQVLAQSNLVNLYKIRRVIIEGNIAEGQSGHILVKKSLSPDPYYFLAIKGKKGIKAGKISRKLLISAFPANAEKIKSVLIEHKNKLKTDEELVQMVKLLNTINEKQETK
jgi:hypothetical protein